MDNPKLKAPKKSGSSANSLVGEISPIPCGLTIVAVRDPCLLQDVRNALETLALSKSKKIGVPMPNADGIRSLYCGNPREMEQGILLAKANSPPAESQVHDFEACGTRDGFDWCCDEGLWVLKPICKYNKGKWITMTQAITLPVTPTVAGGLFRIRIEAQQAGVWVMLFAITSDGYETSRLNELCDEYIETAKCEADPGTNVAFSIDCHGLRNLNYLGIGKSMCSVKLSNGRFRRHYTPFVSTTLENRIIWLLRGQGKKMDEIADILDLDKGTISRRLHVLPPPIKIDMEDGWLERYKNLVDLNGTASPSELGF